MQEKCYMFVTYSFTGPFINLLLEAEGLEIFQGKCCQCILGFVQQPSIMDCSN